ncbi:hypothetical protein [Costertonia aggregata]|uniref:Uncharacterized protein n=1 Tax=Costertonia aggregata TaxID=343403 RepID=A0A7H9AS63_9FLAO|nr:hypothetical protein [Costertonia aggregata]QLG46035.1 hypothetical protein HYG79_12000 [Costertonia aggregata]
MTYSTIEEISDLRLNVFIHHCIHGNGKMIIRVNKNWAKVDSGKYSICKNGTVMQIHKNIYQMSCILKGLIEKYGRFEYHGYSYHSPNNNIWIKERK